VQLPKPTALSSSNTERSPVPQPLHCWRPSTARLVTALSSPPASSPPGGRPTSGRRNGTTPPAAPMFRSSQPNRPPLRRAELVRFPDAVRTAVQVTKTGHTWLGEISAVSWKSRPRAQASDTRTNLVLGHRNLSRYSLRILRWSANEVARLSSAALPFAAVANEGRPMMPLDV